NIAFPLSVRRMATNEIKKRVSEGLDLVGLEGLANRKPSALSGGQQQRVALARAVVFDATLVLMAAPLGAVDTQVREQLQIEIKRIHRELVVTIIYVTHDQSEALTMSDRIAVYADGVVQQLGSPEEIYNTPSNSFVANFIGENNRLDGVIQSNDGEKCV